MYGNPEINTHQRVVGVEVAQEALLPVLLSAEKINHLRYVPDTAEVVRRQHSNNILAIMNNRLSVVASGATYKFGRWVRKNSNNVVHHRHPYLNKSTCT